ncbi:hypothetical protein [uncultured Roseibium sp.]|uniref:hypothetical protein n=1 Tax=uncultured Roseibium sp. TaxID=1936171 RepID=UPI0026101F4B|nr:hypothetical protein [uncultured Roseibium sp.]
MAQIMPKPLMQKEYTHNRPGELYCLDTTDAATPQTDRSIPSVLFSHIRSGLRYIRSLTLEWKNRRHFEKERAKLIEHEPDSVLQDLGITREQLKNHTYRRVLKHRLRSAEIIPFQTKGWTEKAVPAVLLPAASNRKKSESKP